MVTESVNEILDSAAAYACHSGFTYVDVSLIALATLQTKEVKAFLKEQRIDDGAICEEIFNRFNNLKRTGMPITANRFRMSAETVFVYKMGEGLARKLRNQFSPLHLLAGLADGQPGDGHYFITEIMERHGLNGEDLFEYISYTSFLGNKPQNDITTMPSEIAAEVRDRMAKIQAADPLSGSPMLQQFCENLLTKARNGQTDPVIGREQEITRTIRILSRRKKNNPILLGEPGVGKTSIAEELARLIMEGKVPSNLKNKIVLSLDLGALVGGTKWRGELEERLKKLLQEIKAIGNVILFIDEIHLLTGNFLEGSSDLLKPALANGELTAIGATTHSEYLTHFEKDAAMARRFQPVMVNEPCRDVAVNIIKGLLPQYEKHHGVTFDQNIAEYAVDMAIRYNPRQALPDKAIDLVDEAGAVAVNMKRSKVSRECIDVIIHDMAGSGAASLDPLIVVQELRNRIVGQNVAIEAIAKFLRTVDLGIVNGEIKGTLSLSGEAVLNKMDFLQHFAHATGYKVLEIDGQANQHESAIWRLLGAMPGYKDHEKGGQLTEALRRNPRTILAVKNFEIAHPEVKNMVISLITEGLVMDSAKRPVSGGEIYVVFVTDLESENGFGFLGKNTTTEDKRPSLSFEVEELIDGAVVIEQPNEEDLTNMLEAMIQALQKKMQKNGRNFNVSSDLGKEILISVKKSQNKIEQLKQEFNRRIKAKLVSREIKVGQTILLEVEPT